MMLNNFKEPKYEQKLNEASAKKDSHVPSKSSYQDSEKRCKRVDREIFKVLDKLYTNLNIFQLRVYKLTGQILMMTFYTFDSKDKPQYSVLW